MPETYQQLFTDSFLLSVWNAEYQKYLASEDAEIMKILRNWSQKEFQKETEAESAFVNVFFKKIWGYAASGETEKQEGYICHPQFAIPGAGASGGTGKADMALGYFGTEETFSGIPQVLCEFKDIHSGLDNGQKRKGSTRSPVKQCADYLREANNQFAPYGNEAVQAAWAIVTDMNEFRLYSRQSIPHSFQKFVIKSADAETEISLMRDSPEGALQRFLFTRIFRPEMLLSSGRPSALEKLLKDQLVVEKELEKDFYREYHTFREKVFQSLVQANPDFPGTKGRLVRLTQRFLDRCLFVMYCEDMGAALHYPPNLLRDMLIRHSADDFYDTSDNAAWEKVKKLFVSMREGTPFLKHRINRFNGGLFEPDAELEALNIPTFLFCAEQQGSSEKNLFDYPETLLFLSAKYNFGFRHKSGEKNIGLYTLGRIFEQSITDLEYMEACADGRVSLTELSRRKRDGVYYTPEGITHYIVQETVGARLEDVKAELGFDSIPLITDADIEQYQARLKNKRKKSAPYVNDWLNLLDQYRSALDKIKVVDPACGSGAFLIQAFERLFKERQWIARERERIEQTGSLFDMEREMKSVLSNNLYGVDINPESVEITRLALWLRTALPDKPLGVLDKNILCGNSLVGPDFYIEKNPELFPEEKKERINVFDWKAAFPEIFKNNGFDCVIGNPPYIKLQHFRQAQPEVTEYLLTAKKEDGSLRYESTQTGNFDMYLPFIEMGMDLLNEKGRMGFIAPNVWMMNEYGKGLRSKLKRTKRLDRWVDFKSFQVFDEATTYTALQFFRGKECDAIKCYFASDGDISNAHWNREGLDSVSYAELPENEAWNLFPNVERILIDRLNRECKRLEDCCKGISVGIQTSANYIYQIQKITHERYIQKNKEGETVEFQIEDSLMRPIVSGPETKRYLTPTTEIFLLFPYKVSGGKANLINEKDMQKEYPKGFKYLEEYKQELLKRDIGNSGQWYQYGRHQNIEKQNYPKLLIAGTAPELRVTIDSQGNFVANGGRVYTIFFKNNSEIVEQYYLLGILNSPVVNFVFKRMARPKSGGFYDIETQFLAPLPIPDANPGQKERVGNLAKELQELHTARRDKMLLLEKRLQSSQTEADKRSPQWIWADAKSKDALEKRLETLTAYLRPGAAMKAENDNGEIRFSINAVPVIQGIFEDADHAEFIAAQWNHTARTTNITEKFTTQKLLNLLCTLRKTENPSLMKQVLTLDAQIRKLDQKIAEKEREMNSIVYSLYKLSPEEIILVEKDCSITV